VRLRKQPTTLPIKLKFGSMFTKKPESQENWVSESGQSDLPESANAPHRAPCEKNYDSDGSKYKRLPMAEIAQQLSLYQSDPWYHGDHRIPLKALADYCEINRDTLRLAMRGRVSAIMTEILSAAIGMISDGTLSFRRRGQQWEPVFCTPRNPLPPRQARIIMANDWDKWARCHSCEAWKVSVILTHGVTA